MTDDYLDKCRVLAHLPREHKQLDDDRRRGMIDDVSEMINRASLWMTQPYWFQVGTYEFIRFTNDCRAFLADLRDRL